MARVFLTALLFLALTLAISQTQAILPGVKIRVTQNGLNYVNRIANGMLAKELKTITIPNASGSSGRKHWSVWSIRVSNVNVPATRMTLSPAHRGLTWSMFNLGINVHANWRIKYKRGWFKVSTSGSINLSVQRVGVSVTISIGNDRSGRPTASMAACSASVGHVSTKFRGRASFLLNLFRRKIGRKIQDQLRSKICDIIRKQVNTDGTKALSKLKVTVPVAKHFVLDYGLMSAPTVQSKFIDTSHKGKLSWIGDNTAPPFSPKPFPALADSSKMVYLWLSEYTANSMAFAAHRHDFLNRNLKAGDLPTKFLPYLNFICTGMCIGKLSPEMLKKNPKTQIEARVTSTKTPSLTITRKEMTLALYAKADLHALTPDKKSPLLLSVNVNLTVSVHGSIKDDRLVGSITGHSFRVAVTNSVIGEINTDVLNVLLDKAVALFVLPKLNERAAKGVDLPVTGAIKLISPSITLLDGALLISTNVQKLQGRLVVGRSGSPILRNRIGTRRRTGAMLFPTNRRRLSGRWVGGRHLRRHFSR